MGVETPPAQAMDTTGDDSPAQEEEVPSLHIPIQSSNINNNNEDENLFVEIFPEELSHTSVATLLQVLRDEDADVQVWCEAGQLYVRLGKARQALTLLQDACDVPTSDKAKRVRALAATGIASLLAATRGGSKGSGAGGGDPDWTAADTRFTQAGKVDTFFPMTWIGRGMLNLERRSLDQARFFFQTTKKQCGPVLPALLGMAAVLLAEQDYKGALAEYGTAMRRFPTTSGAAARVGLAICAYQLGQVDRSRAAFARALQLDPEYVPALVGTAVLDMRAIATQDADFGKRMEHAIKLMSVANLLDSSNAMVQNHLANHYFWKWTPVRTFVLARPGLRRSESKGQPNSHSNCFRFFSFEQVTGTVDVTQGSTAVTSAQNLPLDPGERIRIGTAFEATITEQADDEEDESAGLKLKISTPWTGTSAKGLKVWKKDYDRVTALAKGAYNATQVDAVKAESLFFLARVYHVRGETEHAHKFYEKACKLAPTLAPARFGLAQTCIAAQEYSKAATHLTTVLQTSTNATDALALLGLLQARSPKTLEEGLGHLHKAIDLDPLNPDLVLQEAIALQQYESHYSQALACYQKAIRLLQRKKAKVSHQLYANCAVLCHETKKYEQALEMNMASLTALDQDGTARHAQLSNMGLEGGQLKHVDNCMFFGYADASFEVEASKTENKKLVTVAKATQASEVSVEANDKIKIGTEFETSVVAVREEDGKVLLEIADDYDPMTVDENVAPEESTDKAVPLAVQRENGLLQIREAITIAFNIARLHEATGRPLAAIELHKAIVKRNPAYVNSYLRLACIAVDCGSLKESSQWLRIAAETAPGNPEVLTLVGNLHLSLADWQPAQKVFDSLLVKKVPNVEAYASLSLGNIYFATLNASPARYNKHLQYASDYYKRILGKDPANAYAANGLGTVLAEKAEIFKAKEVFNRVREVSGDNIADTFINLGHIYLAQKKHSEALQMYKNYMKRAQDGTTPITSKSRVDDVVDVLLYIAFAYFDWARHTELFNDASAAPADGRYKEAMNFLEQAIGKHSKKEVVIRYNLCMTKLQAANCVLQKLTRNIPRTVEEVQEALDNLNDSVQVVEQISKDKAAGQKINISSTLLTDFVNHCRANIGSAESHLEDEKKRAGEADTERELRRLAAEAAQKEEEIKKALDQEEKARKQEQQDEKAAQKMKKVQELQSGWQQEQAKISEKQTKKKTGKAPRPEDDFVVEDPSPGGGLFDDSDDDAPASQPKPTSEEKDGGETKATSQELFGSSDEESGDEGAKTPAESKESAKKAAGDPFADSDEEAEQDNVMAKSAAPAQAAAAAPDLFGEDSDDESDEEIVKADSAKRASPDDEKADDDQPKKKRKLVEEEMEDEDE
jgi:RNA polymerase-associated protein CTR9